MAPSSSLISFGQQKLITQFHLTKGSVSSSSSCSSSGDISLHDPPKLCGGVGLSSRRLSTAGTCSGRVFLVSRNGGRGFGWSSRSRWRLMKKNKRKPLQASSLECSRTGQVKEAQCSNRLHKLNLLSTVPRRILEEEEGCCCCSSADRRVVIAKNSSSKFFSEWPLRLMPNTEDSRSVGGIFSCSCTSAERDQETEHEEGNVSAMRTEETQQTAGVQFAIAALTFYKREISPYLPGSCRYVPTCSEYGIEAFKKYGVLKGAILTAWRLSRCNPFGGSGFDPPRWFGDEKPPPY
ncbi:hypothetical protein CY35_16G015800 [Sphagnum magellanicum]|nr:hypothetical protein CY35_16G015800 [Sphagnum magellanicum]KAH9536747.1 hypothetical protein CY35_16G015800 [Sphagnum magellanicum]